MSEVEMVIPERPVFTPSNGMYGMTVDIPHKEKLKPCPFCGHIPAMCHTKYGWFVMCPSCRTTSDNYSSEEIATEMWNRRPLKAEEVRS